MNGKEVSEILPVDRELAFRNLSSFVQLFGSSPRRLNEPRMIYLLLFIRQGAGHCYIDNEYTTLQAGTLMLVNPFAFLQLSETDLLLGHVILFTEDYFSRSYLDENLLYKCAYDISKKTIFHLNANHEDFGYFKTSIATFGLEYNITKETELKTRLLHTILYSCMLYLHKLQLEDAGEKYNTDDSHLKNKIVEYIQLLNRYFKEEGSLAFYAEKMFLSVKALTQICKKGSGWTPKAIMQAKLLIESKRLLIFDRRPISDIAMELGFIDSASFNRFFSENAGLSIKEFKENNTVRD